MTESQKKLSDKFLEYYRSAMQDKDSQKIPEIIRRADKYWEGDVNKPEDENDIGSNTNIIHSNVEGQVAMMMEQNIAISTVPVSPADIPFADTVTKVLEFIKDKNRLFRKLDIHERRREKYGTGILRVTFNPDALSGYGLPQIDVCSPENIFVDPAITDVYKLQEAQFIIETMRKSVFWAKEHYGSDIADKIEAGALLEDKSEDAYLHMLVWTKEKGKLRLVEMSGCGQILYDSSDEGIPFYENGNYPYFFTPLYYREHSIWGKGDVELLIPVQDVINDLDDQIRRSARLTGNPQRLIETSSGIDLDILTNEAGLNIPTNSINSVRTLTPPSMPAYIMDRRATAFQYEGQKVTRFSDQMMGSKQQGVTTATEVLALQQAGNTSIQHKQCMLQETLSDVFSYCLELVREFWTEEIAIKVTDSANEFIFFKGSDLKNVLQPTGETKHAEFDIHVTVGAGMPQNKAYVYSLLSELTKSGIMSVFEMRNWLRENMGLPLEDNVMHSQPEGDF